MKPAIVERVYAAKGNSKAADELIHDYLPFIKAEASKAAGRIIGDQDDELSLAMLGFHQAVEGYSQLKGAFLNYAALIMRRKIVDYFRMQKRHTGQISLDKPLAEGSKENLAAALPAEADAYENQHMREATRGEIQELKTQMANFGLSLSDIADNCPKQGRTLAACKKALAMPKQTPIL